MVADFDSVNQAAVWNQLGRVAGMARMKAALRLADLLGCDTVVTDAQVLDGIFFLVAGPDGIASLLGRDAGDPVPLLVASECGSLAASLATMRSRADFVWSSSEAVGAARLSVTELDQLRDAWLEAEAEGRFQVQDLTDKVLNLPGELARLPRAPHADDDLDRVLRTAKRRSVAYRLIDERHNGEPSKASDLKRWVNSGYAAAQAIQHDASWIELEASGPATPSPPRSGRRAGRTEGREVYPLGGSLLDDLSTIPGSLYAAIRRRSEKSRTEWSAGRYRLALRTLAMVAEDSLAVPGTWAASVMRSFLRGFLLTALVAIAIVGELNSHLGWLLALTVVSILVKDLPWGELARLVDTRPGALNGVVHIELD